MFAKMFRKYTTNAQHKLSRKKNKNKNIKDLGLNIVFQVARGRIERPLPVTALLFWHSANGAGRVACGPGSVCFLGSAVGCRALFSPHTVSVLALVGGPFKIGLEISTSASLGMLGSFRKRFFHARFFPVSSEKPAIFCSNSIGPDIYLLFNLCLVIRPSIRGLRFHAYMPFSFDILIVTTCLNFFPQ